ncbi:MAG: hypothetical protein HDT47_08840 [Ruminococcaceae bacterium]|nr:hypothetical protein [Oscillospiraceae bacterium]
MGKQYNISELIDGYKDNEFLIDGQQGADTEAVLNGVMAKVKPKKHLRLGVKLLAAAVVAATVSITAVTATASKPIRVYTRANGGTITIGDYEHPYVEDGYYASDDNVYVVENGRVYFTFDNQHLDITDLIDYDTPYYYRSDITDSLGEVHERWIAIGGTPNCVGFGEAIYDIDGNGWLYTSGGGDAVEYYQYYIDGEIVTLLDQWGTDGYVDKYPYRYIEFNWFIDFYGHFKPFSVQECYELHQKWFYPPDWDGELLDDNIPFPEDLREFE